MTLLWLSHLLPHPPRGGVLQRSYHLLREAAARHEVHLVALTQRALHPTQADVRNAIAELSSICATVTALPLRYDASRIAWTAMAASTFFRSTPYDQNWLRQSSLRAYLDTLARTRRFDLIHVDTLGLWPYTTSFPDVPVVLNHHNVESQMMHRRVDSERNPLKRLYLRNEAHKLARMERAVCPKAAVNLTVSDLDQQRLQQVAGPVRCCVVDNGVDVDYFRPTTPLDRPRAGLVFAGSLSWYPNREAVRFFLREIWPALLADNPARSVTIVGANPPRELSEAAQDPRVTAPGFVNDVRPYLDDALIYVCPIRNGGGTRLKILDALAMHKPMVATELAVEGLGMTDGVHYLRAETPQNFVEQIRRLERDNRLRQNLALAGRRLVEERYSWAVVGERLRHAYGVAAQPRPGIQAQSRLVPGGA